MKWCREYEIQSRIEREIESGTESQIQSRINSECETETESETGTNFCVADFVTSFDTCIFHNHFHVILPFLVIFGVAVFILCSFLMFSTGVSFLAINKIFRVILFSKVVFSHCLCPICIVYFFQVTSLGFSFIIDQNLPYKNLLHPNLPYQNPTDRLTH